MGLGDVLVKAFRYVYEYFADFVYKLYVYVRKNRDYKIAEVNNENVLRYLETIQAKSKSDVLKYLKEYYKSGLLEFIGKLGSKEAFVELLDKLLKISIGICLADFILTQWYNNYSDDANKTVFNGALPPDIAFNNLRELVNELLVLTAVTDEGEVMELFFEGLSDAIREILERQLVGGLAITSALQYGSEPADSDDVADMAEFRFIKDKCIDYELLISGAYNSTGGMLKAKGRGRVLENMTYQIHQDILYHNMRMYEVISYPADLIADQVRAIYKNLLIDIGQDLDSAINKMQTQVINGYSVLCSIIDDIDDMTDEEWALLRETTKRSYERQINRYTEKINLIYKLEVLNTASNWDEGINKANEILKDLIQVHNNERAKIMDKLINAEQFVYNVVKSSLDNGYGNIKTVRGGNMKLTDYDVFKNKLLE